MLLFKKHHQTMVSQNKENMHNTLISLKIQIIEQSNFIFIVKVSKFIHTDRLLKLSSYNASVITAI